MTGLDVRGAVFGSSVLRRALTVPAVTACAGALTATAWLWGPAALALDVVRDGRRLPRVRALSLAGAWSSLETAGVALSVVQWGLGRSSDVGLSYGLQRWWAERLVQAMRMLGAVRIEVDGLPALAPGPVVVLARHASIADSLLPVWLLGHHGMHPRYVLKRELLVDPCLDIVGNRVPNHFVVRHGDDTEAELDALRVLSSGMGERDAAVIFPEGTVASDERRTRGLERIARSDAARAARLSRLRWLLPPRAAGARALLEGAPEADVVLVTHTGFEVLHPLADAPARLPLERPVRVSITRVARRDVPGGAGLAAWLDDRWLELDDWVATSARA